MHRIFIAIPISEKLQQEILSWEEKYKKLLVVSKVEPPVRWLAGKNLHITLIPPWYADNNGIKNLKLKIKDSMTSLKPFKIQFEKVTYGPDPRRPRLIWTEGPTPKGLPELKAKLEKALDQKQEKRLFKLHLTIARFRPEDFKNFPVKKLDEEVDWRNEVNKIILMESHLARSGADYEVLSKFKL